MASEPVKYRTKCDERTRRWGAIANKLSPCIMKFINSRPKQYVHLKAILGIPIGFALSVLLYFAVIAHINLPLLARYWLGGTIGLIFGVGIGISIQVRCLMVLCLFTMLNRAGRSFLSAFALGYLVAGPVGNIVFNSNVASESHACTAQLVRNNTMARLQLMFTPIQHIVADLELKSTEMKTVAGRLRTKFKPYETEVKDNDAEITDHRQRIDARRRANIDRRRKSHYQDENKNVEAAYSNKLDYRCEDIYSRAVVKCKDAFQRLEERCKSKIPVVGYILCLPLKLTVACNLLQYIPTLLGLACDADTAVNRGFGGNYGTAKKASEQMSDEFDVDVNYKLRTREEPLLQRTGEALRKKAEYENEARQKQFDLIMTMVKRVVVFLFLRVLYSAYMYQKKYLTDLKFDNRYMTPYFRRIEDRRRANGSLTLLPLKRLEKNELLNPCSPHCKPDELKTMLSKAVSWVIRAIMFGIVIFIDYLMREILDIIQRNSRTTFRQTGEHTIDVKVEGNGSVSSLIRTFITSLNQNETLDMVSDNHECMPNPSSVSSLILLKIIGVMLLNLALVFTEPYALRLRRMACGFYYRKREKRRVLHLYNTTLKNRRGFLKHARHRMARKARQFELEKDASVALRLRYFCPRYCGWLTKIGLGKDTCLICDDKEGPGFVSCDTPGCAFGYCAECWVDIEEKCFACRHPEDWDSEYDLSLDEEELG